MLVEAKRHGVVREVAAIVAGLSIQDVRERPLEKRAQADQLHARFADPTSDFLGLLKLWNYLEEQQKELSSSAFRRLCKTEFLNYLRIREWQDLYRQLIRPGSQLGIKPGEREGRPRRHPPVAARRPAQPHRPARRASHEDQPEGEAARGGAEEPRVPRRAQPAVRDLPRLDPGPQGTSRRDGRRAGRDAAGCSPARSPRSIRPGRRRWPATS